MPKEISLLSWIFNIENILYYVSPKFIHISNYNISPLPQQGARWERVGVCFIINMACREGSSVTFPLAEHFIPPVAKNI